jgi:hypothetical protein
MNTCGRRKNKRRGRVDGIFRWQNYRRDQRR